MAYEFKKLSEVTTLEEIPENVSLIGESNGEIVRLPSNGLGGGVDMVIVFNNYFEGATIDDIVIKSGTVAEVLKKLKNNESVNVAIVNPKGRWGSYSSQTTCCIAYQVSEAGDTGTIGIRWQYAHLFMADQLTPRHYLLVLENDEDQDRVRSYTIGS